MIYNSMRVLNIISCLLLTCFLSCNSQISKNDNQQKQIDKIGKKSNLESVIRVLHQTQQGDTLMIVSDSKLIWRPFITDLNIDSLQLNNGNIFEIQKEKNIFILRTGDSYIKLLKNIKPEGNLEDIDEYYYSIQSPFKLIEAEIFDNIQLQYEISVGMSKSTFLSLLGLQDLKANINVIEIFDPPGDFIEQTYMFEDNKLYNIKMKSPY